MWLNLEAEPGEYIGTAAAEGCRVANQLGLVVFFKFNGVRVCCKPGDRWEAVAASFERSFREGRQVA